MVGEKKRCIVDLYISQFVLDEAQQGDADAASQRMDILAELEINEDARRLTELLLEHKAVPLKAMTDAAHIAVATVHEMDFLLTWNCRHIANAQMLTNVYAVCEFAGYRCPLVCTPAELMEGTEDEN